MKCMLSGAFGDLGVGFWFLIPRVLLVFCWYVLDLVSQSLEINSWSEWSSMGLLDSIGLIEVIRIIHTRKVSSNCI